MKTINATATAILNKMVSMMEDGHIRINNTDDFFMPVSVETIMDNDKYMIISVAHYYEHNSDLLADPEMLFIYDKTMNVFFPSYFKQDGFIAQEQESIIMNNGEIIGIRTKMQADHTTFANMWLKNIKFQQNL